MVFVVLSGLPLDVDPANLAEQINIYFGDNKEIGTFRMNIDDSDIRKPKAVLKFKQGFDAMEAQRLLDKFTYIDPEDKLIYTVKAVVATNGQPYQSLFCEEVTDIADIIVAEKKRHKKERKAKKRRHSSIDKNLLADQFGLSENALGTADIEELKRLCKKLKKKSEKAERRSSRSDRSASESEYKKRDKSFYGESSGVSTRPKSPEDPVHKKKHKKERSLERKDDSYKTSTSTTHKQSRYTTTNDSASPRSSNSPKDIPKHYRRPCTPDDTASSKSYDSRKVKNEYRRQSESRSSDERKHHYPERDRWDYRSSSRPHDLRHKVETRTSYVRAKRWEFERYYDRNTAHLDSPRRRQTSHSEGTSWTDKEIQSSNESTDPEYNTISELVQGKKLILFEPSHYLTENDVEFKEALSHILQTVVMSTERLQDEDEKIILDNYTATVVSRLKGLKFTNLMSVQDIVLDYKLVYNTADDKLLINNMIKELQALGKGILMPEIKRERLGQAIDEVFETTTIDELMEDVKPIIKSENTLKYEYEDGETTEVINIVVNLVPIEKRELPFETDPDKIADIKVFVSKLKNTKPSKFFRPIRSLLNEMKLFIYNNAKVVPSEVILNRMVEVLEKILARMMGPIKTRVKSKDVCNLFRNSFPYKEDREFVDMIIKWIVDGEFDKGAIDELITEKIPKIEKNTTDEENSTNIHILPVSIKTEPQDTDSKPTLTVPTKMEIEDKNQSERTVTTNIPNTAVQEASDAEIKREQPTNVTETIDEDIIIKKEPVELILIEDDDLVTKEPVDYIPVTTKVKLETTNVSDSGDEGAMSDDSRTTLVIETKPYIGNDPAIEVTTQNIEHGTPGERLGEPGEILDESGVTIDRIRQYLESDQN